jgi:formyltetrahydrofolate deformylase
MRVIITAVGPNNWGLADSIVQYVTSVGACIAEIQMYDHEDGLFAMLLRLQWPGTARTLTDLRSKMAHVGREHGLSIRTWSRDEHDRPPRLALCTTYRHESPRAVLQAIRTGELNATAAVLIGNRPACESLAKEFGVDWHAIGDAHGNPDNERMVQLFDRYEVDYVVLARYMRLVPPATCWKFAGGRIINLHHGLLPAFPGAEPYRDAYAQRMLTFGATTHFIVPELDAGGQIIHQETFTVAPGTPLQEVVRMGQTEHEPRCLVEGLRRVLDRQVELQFHKVAPVARPARHWRYHEARAMAFARSCLGAVVPVPDTAGLAVPLQQDKALAIPARSRFDQVTLGLFLGALVFGTAGCIFGARMPYSHPVAVAISVVWWGIYLGCLGAAIGAGVGGLLRLSPGAQTWFSAERRGVSPRREQRQSPKGERPGHDYHRISSGIVARKWPPA